VKCRHFATDTVGSRQVGIPEKTRSLHLPTRRRLQKRDDRRGDPTPHLNRRVYPRHARQRDEPHARRQRAGVQTARSNTRSADIRLPRGRPRRRRIACGYRSPCPVSRFDDDRRRKLRDVLNSIVRAVPPTPVTKNRRDKHDGREADARPPAGRWGKFAGWWGS